jgi:hypothetical protein
MGEAGVRCFDFFAAMINAFRSPASSRRVAASRRLPHQAFADEEGVDADF